MDKQSYLDQIAVKENKGPGPLLTPLMIKVIVAGLIALITIVIVGNILSSSNTKETAIYERLYSRIENLHGSSGPQSYTNQLRSSSLIAYTNDLDTSLTNTANQLKGVIAGVGVDPANINSDNAAEETARITAFKAKIDDSILNGTINSTFATALAAEVDQLMILERQVLSQNSNAALAEVVTASLSDLEIIYNHIHDLSLNLN